MRISLGCVASDLIWVAPTAPAALLALRLDRETLISTIIFASLLWVLCVSCWRGWNLGSSNAKQPPIPAHCDLVISSLLISCTGGKHVALVRANEKQK